MLTTSLHPAFQTPIENEIDGKTVNTNNLLSDLLQSPGALTDIAREHKLTLQQLIVWCDQPAVRTLLDQADALAARIAAHKTAQARPGAVHVLATQTCLLETVKDRENARKAARTLVSLPADAPTTGPQPIAEMRLPCRARSSRPHTAGTRRAPMPSEPPSSVRIPVYRFRLSANPMMAPGFAGPIQPTPSEVIDSAPSAGAVPDPATPPPRPNGP